MAALCRVVRRFDLSGSEAFERITNWSAHQVPLTSITLTEHGFNARTAIGPLGFDDPMDVVAFEPPHFCRIEKRGTVVTGWAEITVRDAGTGCEVEWIEQLGVAKVPRLFDPFVRAAGNLMLAALMKRTIGS